MSDSRPDPPLAAPEIAWTDQKRRTFDDLFHAARAHGPARPIAYDAPYPRHEFLAHVVERHGVVLHGSNRHDIDVFEPRAQTDYVGRPIQAVFATPDSIWPLFFALLRREGYVGSMRNACFRAPRPDGTLGTFYRFSINQRVLEGGDAWTDGMLYLLPRDTFAPVRDHDGEPLAEWASPHPVRPLARLPVTIADFPFADAVRGHDDGGAETMDVLLREFVRWDDLPDGCALAFVDRPGLRALLETAVSFLESVVPDLRVSVVGDGAGGWSLEMRGPERFREMLRDAVERTRGAR